MNITHIHSFSLPPDGARMSILWRRKTVCPEHFFARIFTQKIVERLLPTLNLLGQPQNVKSAAAGIRDGTYSKYTFGIRQLWEAIHASKEKSKSAF